MRWRKRTVSTPWGGAATAAALVFVIAGACTDEERRDLVDQGTEAVVRNVAATAGTFAFEREGFEVPDPLDCEATSTGGAERVDLRCTGTTRNGRELVLEGEAQTGSAEVGDAIRGTFVGTADGKEVFREDCLGDDC